jgi:hypothetical protein
MSRSSFLEASSVFSFELNSRIYISVLTLVAFGILALSAPTAHAQTFLPFDAPGAGTAAEQGTFPLAINSSGLIVGYFVDSGGVQHGFMRAAGGTFTTVDVPGSSGTQVTAVNSLGLAVGYSYSSDTTLGFLRYRNGTFRTLKDPGTSYTQPVAMNDSGEVAGDIGLSPGIFRGFVWSATQSFTIVSYRYYAGYFVGVTALNSSGVTVGSYSDHFKQRIEHAFLRDNTGNVTSFDATDTSLTTAATAINTSGQIAGWYVDTNDEVFPFLRDVDGTITPFTVAGGEAHAASINDDGVIVGTAFADNYELAFERDAAGNISILSLPFNVGNIAVAINASGRVIGNYYDSRLVSHGWLMTP